MNGQKVIFFGTGYVWDPKTKKMIARFNHEGEFHTDNPYVIKELIGRNYVGDYDPKDWLPDTPIPAEALDDAGIDQYSNMDIGQLKKLADIAGIKYGKTIGAATLIKRLKAKEASDETDTEDKEKTES